MEVGPAYTPNCAAVKELTTIVSDNKGTLSFLVRRMEAEVADNADFRARCNEESGTSKLITLFAADCMV